ncbi:MAG: PKD domain-containing protein [Bacteroidota bacterium]
MKHVLSLILILSSFFSYSQAVARVSTPDSIVCLGECVTLSSSTSTNGGSPIINSIWSISGPNNYTHASNTAPGVNLTLCDFVAPGDYTISLINQHQNQTSSFVQKVDFITVQQNPVADIGATVNTCQLPFNVSYTVGGSTPVPPTNYVWSFAGGTPSSFTGQTPPTVSYTTAGTSDTRLIVTDPVSGCKDTLIRPITVGPFDAGITSPALACLNSSVQFTDASTIGANSWTWSATGPGTASISSPSSQNPTISFDAVGIYTITLSSQNTAVGCAGSTTTTINVVPLPFAKFTATPIAGCSPLPVQFTNQTINAAGNIYSWNFGDGSNFTGPNPGTHIYTGINGQSFTASLTVMDINGCFNSNVSDTVITLVTPAAHFSVSEKDGCEGLNVTFTNQSQIGGSPFVSQTWIFEDNSPSGTTTFIGANPPPISYLCGEYNITLIVVDQQGCVDTTMLDDNYDSTFVWTTSVNGLTTVPQFSLIPPFDLLQAFANDTVIKFGTIPVPKYTLNKNVECVKHSLPFQLVDITPIDCPHDPTDVKRQWFFNKSPQSTDSVFNKVFSDTMMNIGLNLQPGTDIDLEVNFRGCRDTLFTFDSIYIYAPKSSFLLVPIDPLCDLAQGALPLTKRVGIDDTQGVYSHGWTNQTFFPTQRFPIPGHSIPSKTMDDVGVIYRWGDGTVETSEDIDAFLDDIPNKGGDIDPANASTLVAGSRTTPDPVVHTFNDYGDYSVEQVVINRTTGCRDSTTQNITFSWVETNFVFDIPGPDSICVNNPFDMTSTSATHGLPTAQTDGHLPLSYNFSSVPSLSTAVSGSGSTTNQTFSTTITTPGDYNVTITATNSAGCANTFTNHITVFALPIANITTTDVTTVCVGTTLTVDFDNSSIHPPGSYGENDPVGANWATPNAFAWTSSNGSPSPSPFTQNYSDQLTSTMSGPSTFTLQVTDGFGCVSSIASFQTNQQQPTAAISLPPSICNYDVVNASPISSVVTGLTSYVWIVDGLQSPPSPIDNIPVPPTWEIPNGPIVSQNHSVQLIVTDALGCTNTSPISTVTILAPQANYSDAQFSASGGANGNYTCPPVVVNFCDSSQSTSPIVSYSWQLGNIQSQPLATTSTLQCASGIQYLFPGTYNIIHSITDAAGCVSTITTTPYLTIGGPTALDSIRLIPTFCGQTYHFEVLNQNIVDSWTWDMGDGTIISSVDNPADTFNYTYTGVDIFNPVLTVIDALDCPVEYTGLIDIPFKGIDAAFTADPITDINLGTTVTFDPSTSTSEGSPIIDWQWEFGDGFFDSTDVQTNVSHSYLIGDTVTVKLTIENSDGCSDFAFLSLVIGVEFDFPNVLTGDGSNGPNADYQLFADVMKSFEITIVNRWGNVVHEGKLDPARPRYLWNGVDDKSGKLCNEGTYFYLFKGILKNDVPVDIHGFCTLIGTTDK